MMDWWIFEMSVVSQKSINLNKWNEKFKFFRNTYKKYLLQKFKKNTY
jgi:hypothetical protein